MTNRNKIISFVSFSKIPNLIHGFSTREFGSMGPNDLNSDMSFKMFSSDLKINPENRITMQQVHSNNIQWVTHEQNGWRMLQTDGILTQEKNTFLSVLAADCVPVLIFDTRLKKLGAVHAGWKGIYNEILKEAVLKLINDGSKPEDLLIGIGPCIRSCCYNITRARANLFRNKFKGFSNILKKDKKKEFLDLAEIAKQQLILTGIPAKNIEDCNICTYDHEDLLFSYRREGEKFGKFIGIIGRI